MDTTNADPSEELHIDWSSSEVWDDAAETPLDTDASLHLPESLFGEDSGPGNEAPALDLGDELEADSAWVLDDLFPESAGAPAPAAEPAVPVTVGDMFDAAPAVAPSPARTGKPRLAPPPAPPTRTRDRKVDLRRLGIAGGVVVAVIALVAAFTGRNEPSVDVQSTSSDRPSTSLTASTRPVATTAAPALTSVPAPTTTVTTAPGTGAAVTPTTAAPAPTVGETRTTSAPSPATTAAPPATAPATTAPAPVTTVPDTLPPVQDTTVTTRRSRETIPPPSSSTTVTSVVEADEEE